MNRRYILSPEAGYDLVGIWRYIGNNASVDTADRVEAVIREKFAYLARNPEGGHWRRDLTNEAVKFFAVYSYLVVYRPGTKPLQIVAILHGHRDLKQLLSTRV